MHLTYAQVEDFLAEIHNVVPEKRTALKGRIKHFQRLGWPRGANTGKGARVAYGVSQVCSLAMAFELAQIGMAPEHIVEHLRHGETMLSWIFDAAHRQEIDQIYALSRDGLAGLAGEDEYFPRDVALTDADQDISSVMQSRRAALVNVTDLVRLLVQYVEREGLGMCSDICAGLERWPEEDHSGND